MRLGDLWAQAANVLPRGGETVKCFEHELLAVGGVAHRCDLGIRTVPVMKIVGSVGRWASLRGDFFEKDGSHSSHRYMSIGKAMARGSPLPALELYELRTVANDDDGCASIGEYYVVDGHHRVAMARKLGVLFLDAHVIAYWTVRARREENP